jgi:hypothetical protein
MDSPQKLSDQARTEKGIRNSLWIMLVGIVFIVALIWADKVIRAGW